MNRRALAWVSAAVVAIVAVAWWLSANDAVAPTRVAEQSKRPATPVQAPVIPVVPSTPILPELEPIAPVIPDAALAEVEIEILEGWGKKAIGVHVELEGPGGAVSRPTDIMGYARFTLPTGSWRITAPGSRRVFRMPSDGEIPWDWHATLEQSRSAPLEVTAPISRFRLLLPTVWRVGGRVVDSEREPAPGATVSWAPFGPLDTRVTSTDGSFTIETTEETVLVQAKRGSARSRSRAVSPREHSVTLVLEEWTQLKVDVNSSGGDRGRVRVLHRDELIAHGSDDEPLLVPVGHLTLLARRNVRGHVHAGKAEIDTKAEIINHVEVDLSPTPPLRGTLVDGEGRPMAGLGVFVREVDPTTIALRSNGGVQPPRAAASTITNHLGEFTWMPHLTRSADPVYQVMVVELWRTQADPVLVRLDDAPLNIVVEPAP